MKDTVSASSKEINYTIIIPHFNIPDLLKRCLCSIPKRNDLQIIVVDDFSSPEVHLKLKHLEKEFSYVDFIYLPENGGAGKARNEGLTFSQGKYVFFADADDYFNYCINEILDDYKNSEFDIAFFNANSVETDTYIARARSLHLNRMIKKYKRNKDKALFLLRYSFGEPWCKLVKREIIMQNSILFDETLIHNDTKFSYLVGFHCNDAIVDNRAIYCVTDRSGSVSKNVSQERLFARTYVFAQKQIFLKKYKLGNLYDANLFYPMITFLVKLRVKDAKRCFEIIKESGLSNMDILKCLLCVPFNTVHKTYLKFLKVLHSS